MRRGIAVLLLAAAACSTPTPDDGRLTVVAAFYPLYEAAMRVAGSGVSVTNLTNAGAEPHEMELTSKQVDVLREADVVIYLGGGFQPSLEAALRDVDGRVVDALSGLKTIGEDPHVWLDPTLLSAIAGRVAGALAKADPAGADGFRERASAYQAELAALDEEIRADLGSCAKREIVTSHEAFGYFAARYGLIAESIAIDPEAEPDPKRLDELAKLVADKQVKTIFSEELVSPKVAETLARETGVSTAVLSPIEGADQGETYASLMRENVTTLRAALSCT